MAVTFRRRHGRHRHVRAGHPHKIGAPKANAFRMGIGQGLRLALAVFMSFGAVTVGRGGKGLPPEIAQRGKLAAALTVSCGADALNSVVRAVAQPG